MTIYVNTLEEFSNKPKLYVPFEKSKIVPLIIKGFIHNANVKVEFIKMSDQSKDFNIDIKADDKGRIILPATKFSKGFYRLQMKWESQGKPYVYRDQFKFLEA